MSIKVALAAGSPESYESLNAMVTSLGLTGKRVEMTPELYHLLESPRLGDEYDCIILHESLGKSAILTALSVLRHNTSHGVPFALVVTIADGTSVPLEYHQAGAALCLGSPLRREELIASLDALFLDDEGAP